MAHNIFHQAAKDGYLDLLKEATKRDCNAKDEDGMTPGHWAAFYGNLDALRVIIARGGNPDKCDLYGNSSLHLAANNGHMNCVSFLVNYGINIWLLDNDLRTALELAALHEHVEIVKYLDTVAARQSNLNTKLVKKFKEKAALQAQKRIKRYRELQAKVQRQAEKHDLRLAQQGKSPLLEAANGHRQRAASELVQPPKKAPAERLSTNFPKSINSDSAETTISTEAKPFSEYVTARNNGRTLTGIAKKILLQKGGSTCETTSTAGDFVVRETLRNGTKTIRSLSGVRRDSQVLFTRGSSSRQDDDAVSRAVSEPNMFRRNSDPAESSIFDRPGFGSVAFIRHPPALVNLFSLPTSENNSGPKQQNSENSHNGSHLRNDSPDSIGTVGTLAGRVIAKGQDPDFDVNYLDGFLTGLGLSEFLKVFTKEKIDFEALLLLSEADLKELGLPMGPRKKLLEARERRRGDLAWQGSIMESRL